MHKNPRRSLAPQSTPPLANVPLWHQLPILHRRQCHDLLTQLLITVIHSEPSEEKSDERQD
jgi:hypothetical protein